jgi:ribulose-phosphate 3-epimerase
MEETLNVEKTLPLVSTSILGANWLAFGDAVKLAEDVGTDLFQIDVADGCFVPTISFGEEIVRSVHNATNVPIEAHLMVSRPQDWVDIMAERGADVVIFHFEAVQRVHSILDMIKRAGMGVGVALNSETRPDVLEYILPYIDVVTLMAILPGFSGQPFLPEAYDKISLLRKMIDEREGCHTLIEVDGGVKGNTIEKIIAAGADSVVVSSGIYQAKDPHASMADMRASMKRAWEASGARNGNLRHYFNEIARRRAAKKG